MARQPGRDGLRIPLGGLRGAPRLVEGYLLGHAIQARLGLGDVGEHDRVELGDRAAVSREPAAVLELVEAVVVGLEQLEAELADPGVDAQLRGADPLAADLDDARRLRAGG